MKPHESAKQWRERHQLTVAALADLTGFSWTSIYMFERGVRQDGKKLSKHSEFSWQRYKMACAAVDQQLRSGKVFEW